ncbi:MAG: PAS domain S-box protein [Methanoregula sp.]|nr:MAG: PAS domain S-box protein [Methanoregula sp.]
MKRATGSKNKETEGVPEDLLAKYSILAENCPYIIYHLSLPDGHYKFVSSASEPMLGYHPDEMYQKPWFIEDIIHPVSRQYWNDMKIRLCHGDVPSFFEYQIVHKSGECRWLHQRNVVIHDENGQLIGINGIITDITKRRLAEEALRDKEELLHEIFNNANDAIFLHEMTPEGPGQYITVNDIAVQSLGYTREEMRHMSPRDIVPAAILHDILPDITKQMEKEGGATFESVHKRKDGSIFPVEVSTHIFPFRGRPVALSITRDITGRRKAEAELRESEEKLRSILDSSGEAIYGTDLEGNSTFVNQACIRILGYSNEGELLGKNMHLQIHHHDANGTFKPVEKCRLFQAFVKGEGVHIDDEKLWRADGTCFSAEIWSYPRRRNGVVTGAVVAFVDITGRRKAEAELRDSESRLNSIIQASPIPKFVIDRDHRVIFWNSALEKYSGIKAGELLGTNQQWRAFYLKERPCMADLLVDGATEKIPQWYEGKYAKSRIVDGAYEATDFFPHMGENGTWLHFTAAPINDSSGLIIGAVETLEDITDRKKAEEEIRAMNLFQTSIISNANVLLMVLDPHGNIQTWNQAAEDISGYGEQEVKGNSTVWKKLYPDKEYRKTITKNIERIISQNNFLENLETIIHCKNGTKKTILWNTRSLPDAKGAATGYVAIGVDVTERKKAEELQKHFTEELEKQVISRTGELNASLQEKVVLLREIHHRVKNNLQIIISLLNLQSRYIKDEKTQQIIKESQNRLKAMSLVHERLYQSEDISKIDLDGYVKFLGRNLVDFYGVRRQDVALKTDISGISVGINTAIPVGLILNELLSNSLKHAFPGGRKGEISIGIKRENDMLTILFKDTGAGLPADLDWRNGKTLGLRLVISLVEQLFGTIELDRTAGTSFTIVVKEKE